MPTRLLYSTLAGVAHGDRGRLRFHSPADLASVVERAGRGTWRVQRLASPWRHQRLARRRRRLDRRRHGRCRRNRLLGTTRVASQLQRGNDGRLTRPGSGLRRCFPLLRLSLDLLLQRQRRRQVHRVLHGEYRWRLRLRLLLLRNHQRHRRRERVRLLSLANNARQRLRKLSLTLSLQTYASLGGGMALGGGASLGGS